jgi:ankyrin repeat protein
MDLERLPFHASLEVYRKQAEQLLAAHLAGVSQAIKIFHENHPRFLDPKVLWLPRNLPDSKILETALDLADAQLTIARWYNFQNWAALAQFVAEVTRAGSPVLQFETAVEAVITGDLAKLESLLRGNPDLVRARSTRITHFDPPLHRSTLLHYVAANGVEGYRQKTPPNAVEIAKALLQAGAEVDSLADLYGGGCTTMSLLVSSCHPAQAGVQVALVDTLVDFGASVDGIGSTRWKSNLMTALVFRYLDTAQALVRRGARVDYIATAAGLGRLAETAQLLPASDADGRHRALALAAQLGHVEVVRLLLDAGEDPNRYNPDGTHSHSTPLHQATLAGHDAVVRLLVERGARLDIKDTIYQGTPLGWARHGRQTEIVKYLEELGQ